MNSGNGRNTDLGTTIGGAVRTESCLHHLHPVGPDRAGRSRMIQVREFPASVVAAGLGDNLGADQAVAEIGWIVKDICQNR